MSEKQYMAADLRGPLNTWTSTDPGAVPSGVFPPRDRPLPSCQIVALLVASGVSQQFDLTATGMFGDDLYQQKFLRLHERPGSLLHGMRSNHSMAGRGNHERRLGRRLGRDRHWNRFYDPTKPIDAPCLLRGSVLWPWAYSGRNVIRSASGRNQLSLAATRWSRAHREQDHDRGARRL